MSSPERSAPPPGRARGSRRSASAAVGDSTAPTGVRPVGRQRVAEEIVGQLRTLILRGVYAAGDKLPPERKLALDLGVNRASLREAIKALEQAGFVKTRQGDGTRVLDFMTTAGVELVSHLLAGAGADAVRDRALLSDVLDFRRWFGREVARVAALRASDVDRKRLVEIAARAAEARGAEELLRHDFDFYVALTLAGRNRVLQLLINTIRAAVEQYATFFSQATPPATVVRAHHQAILGAITTRDGQAAYAAADEYLRRSAALLVGSEP